MAFDVLDDFFGVVVVVVVVLAVSSCGLKWRVERLPFPLSSSIREGAAAGR